VFLELSCAIKDCVLLVITELLIANTYKQSQATKQRNEKAILDLMIMNCNIDQCNVDVAFIVEWSTERLCHSSAFSTVNITI